MRQQDRGLFLPARWPAPARCHGPVQACNSQTRFPECVMIIIIGLVILVAAVVAGVAGVLSNGGSGHALTHPFAVFGYHVTGSTGTLFLYGIVVGVLALLWLSLLLAGARRTSRRGHEARRGLRQSRPRPPPSARTATTSSASATPPAPTLPARWVAAWPAVIATLAKTAADSAACGTRSAAGPPPRRRKW